MLTNPQKITVSENADNFYEKYGPALYGFISKRVPYEKDADIIFQESITYAFRHLQFYDEKKYRMFTWLVQIASARIIASNNALQDYIEFGLIPC